MTDISASSASLTLLLTQSKCPLASLASLIGIGVSGLSSLLASMAMHTLSDTFQTQSGAPWLWGRQASNPKNFPSCSKPCVNVALSLLLMSSSDSLIIFSNFGPKRHNLQSCKCCKPAYSSRTHCCPSK